MKKTEKNYWIKPPSTDSLSTWLGFIAIGNLLRDKSSTYRNAGVLDEKEQAKIIEKLKGQDQAPAQKQAASEIHDDETPDYDRNGHRDEFNRALSTQTLIELLNKESVFPFLAGKNIPLTAKAIIAMLLSQFVERQQKGAIDNLYKIFRLLQIPPQDYESEGIKLLEYANSTGSFLKILKTNTDVPNHIAVLNRAGFKALLQIDIGGGDRYLPEYMEKDLFSPFPDRDKSVFKQKKKKKEDDRWDVVVPTTTLKDVVLDQDSMFKLRYLVEYCLSDKKAVFTTLFHGKAGVGKTLTAHALAGELRRKILAMDLSKTLSMWVGGTEKGLSAQFSYARSHNAILLIDEADSYLKARAVGNRSFELKFVNHLLALLEKRECSVILSTNFFDALDESVLRRIDQIVYFSVPSKEARADIWRKELVKNTIDTEDIDIDTLKSIEITGGLISNVCRTAYRMKVVMKEDLGLDTVFLQKLAEEEQVKMGKAFTERKICGFGG